MQQETAHDYYFQLHKKCKQTNMGAVTWHNSLDEGTPT